MQDLAIQDRFAPEGRCFGCGPANDRGLRIKSHVVGDDLVASWQPEKHHEAFEGVLCGGIIGTLLDCHCNWAAVRALMEATGAETAPCTVTADYAIKLRRPTPTGGPVTLRARAVEVGDGRAVVEGTLEAGGRECATCRGTFVAVGEGHPAFHRW